jgi:hypothetical protein
MTKGNGARKRRRRRLMFSGLRFEFGRSFHGSDADLKPFQPGGVPGLFSFGAPRWLGVLTKRRNV